MNATSIQRLHHLAWRSGFGLTPEEWTHWQDRPVDKYLHKVVFRQGHTAEPIQGASVAELAALSPRERLSMIKSNRKAFNQMNAKGIRELNLTWLDQMTFTEHPLHEKMALFWHGHFACRVINAPFNQQLLGIIRQHALGNFGDLLIEVSKSPAMLVFLNNQQNRKQHPNENFAREVMELFTMGRGHYTEQDVKEGARAFTGWGFNPKGEFVFRKNLHDSGVKEFLGKRGPFTGDDILRIILDNPDTAHFITQKLVNYFAGEGTSTDRVNSLAQKFYQSGYDIPTLLHGIFESEWFYAPSGMGNRIKSPIELWVGLRRTIAVSFKKPEVQLLFQRIMGQTLFFPPNVGGWPGGRSWIDSSSLLFRMRLPELVYYSGILDVKPKDMPDEMSDEMSEDYGHQEMQDPFIRRFAMRLNAQADWNGLYSSLEHIPDEKLASTLVSRLLTGTSSAYPISILNQFSDHKDRSSFIQSAAIHIMSSPEYQLC